MAYDQHAYAAARSRQKSYDSRDIGPLPPVKDSARKLECLQSLKLFCVTYRAHKFTKPFSDDQLEVIAAIEEVVIQGGLRALGMFRAGGKSQLCISGVEWAILSGKRKAVSLIGATDPDAVRLMKEIKWDFEHCVELGEDFPEVCHAIRALEGINSRAPGQHLGGVRTSIVWSDTDVSFPVIAGSLCAGATIRTRGLTGAIRGPRQDLVLLDDPQSRESAGSVKQTRDRKSIIEGDVLELAGRDVAMAALMTATVIYKGDLADQFLDREICPAWRGKKMPMVYSFPQDEKAWDEYAKLRRESFRMGGNGQQALDYYSANKERMDAGARLSWPHSWKPGDLSALQSAMNFRIDRPAEFAAEAQLTPLDMDYRSDLVELEASEIIQKVNQVERYQVPRDCNRLTAFVDVHAQILYYMVVGWSERFGGGIVDYGVFPAQGRSYFSAHDARPSLASIWPNLPDDARIFNGLIALTHGLETTPGILARSYLQQETGALLTISRCLVDAGYAMTAVCDFVRKSPQKQILLPSRGWGITAARAPISEWARKEGQRHGQDWMITAPNSERGRVANVDANAWKSFARARLAAGLGEKDSVNLYGDVPHVHAQLCDHLTAEYRDPKPGRGRIVEEWKQRPNRENHFWDCFVGCCVAASIDGLRWDVGALAQGRAPQQTQPKKRIRISELYADRQRREQAPKQPTTAGQFPPGWM
jgi:hypothetical protein